MRVEWFVTLDEIPRTSAQEKGVRIVRGRPMFYTKSKVLEVERLYSMMIRTHKPERPLKGAIKVKVLFIYPVKKPHKNGEPKQTRPDVDNMVKVLLDSITKSGAYWNDDGQICDLRIIKRYGEPSGIGFQAVEIDKGGLEVDN